MEGAEELVERERTLTVVTLEVTMMQIVEVGTLRDFVLDNFALEARVGDPTLVAVEGKTFAHGRLGTHRGQLAVRIEHMERDEERLG